MPLNEGLAEKILEITAQSWPYGILNMKELREIIEFSSEEDALLTLDGLQREDKISFKNAVRTGGVLRAFVGLQLTPYGRRGREKLAQFDRGLAARILRHLASRWPESIQNLQVLKESVQSPGTTDESWLTALRAMEIANLIELEHSRHNDIGVLQVFVGARATISGRDAGRRISDEGQILHF